MILANFLLASLGPWSAAMSPVVSPALEPEPPNSHLWIVNELFSSADGTVQFLELWECCGSSIETQMTGKPVFSLTHSFPFPDDLVGDTSHRYLLLGTAAYAALPGAAAPDYLIPSNFFSTVSDTVRWHIYPAATLSYTSGQLPLDGFRSLNHNHSIGINSPTNWNGETGFVTLSGNVPAFPVAWLVVLVGAALGIGAWLLRAQRMGLGRPA